MVESTLCEIIKDGKLLLKLANRGVSDGKWNGLGGKLEGEETVEENLVREVREESGLVLNDFKKHGILRFYKGSRENLFFTVHLFSSKDFDGEMKLSDEGDLKWFDLETLPFERMWPDDIYWMEHLLAGREFDADFIFDENMKTIKEHDLRLR